MAPAGCRDPCCGIQRLDPREDLEWGRCWWAWWRPPWPCSACRSWPTHSTCWTCSPRWTRPSCGRFSHYSSYICRSLAPEVECWSISTVNVFLKEFKQEMGKLQEICLFKGNNVENYRECVFKRNSCGKRENYRQHLHPVVFVCVPDEEWPEAGRTKKFRFEKIGKHIKHTSMYESDWDEWIQEHKPIWISFIPKKPFSILPCHVSKVPGFPLVFLACIFVDEVWEVLVCFAFVLPLWTK